LYQQLYREEEVPGQRAAMASTAEVKLFGKWSFDDVEVSLKRVLSLWQSLLSGDFAANGGS